MKNKITTLAFFALLVSCGSTKKNKTSSEIESEKTTDTRTNTLITENTDSYTISPADLTQPITFGGKTYTNTVIKWQKENKVTEVDEDKKVAEKFEIKETTKDKETDYTSFIIAGFITFIVMFIILLVFIHIQLKKNPLS